MHEVAGPWGVRVLRERCRTCVFRPGNLMQLMQGRVAGMLAECEANEGHITCHETFDREAAICRGFYDSHTAHRSLAIRYGKATNSIVLVDPPAEDFLNRT